MSEPFSKKCKDCHRCAPGAPDRGTRRHQRPRSYPCAAKATSGIFTPNRWRSTGEGAIARGSVNVIGHRESDAPDGHVRQLCPNVRSTTNILRSSDYDGREARPIAWFIRMCRVHRPGGGACRPLNETRSDLIVRFHVRSNRDQHISATPAHAGTSRPARENRAPKSSGATSPANTAGSCPGSWPSSCCSTAACTRCWSPPATS